MAILLNSKFKGRGLVRTIFFLPILLGSGAVLETLELATQNIQGGAAAMSTEMAPVAGVNVDYFLSILLEVGLPVRLLDFIVGLVGGIYEIVRASVCKLSYLLRPYSRYPLLFMKYLKLKGQHPTKPSGRVTFPMVSPLILTNVVYTIVDKFVNSQVVDIAYSTAFTNYNYGLSSAMSVISTVIVCLILLIVGGLITKITFYYNLRRRIVMVRNIVDQIRDLKNDTVFINKQARYIHIFKSPLLNFKFIILLGISFIILGTIINIISNSFFSSSDVYNPSVFLFPLRPTWENFRLAYLRLDYWKTLGYTLLYVSGLTLIQLVITSMAGYGFARFDFPFKKLLFACVIITIVLPTHTIMLPLYQHFRGICLGSYR